MIGYWIEAMRLRTLPVSVAGVVTALAYNLKFGNFNAVPWVICLLFAVMAQVASNFANEYFDYKEGRDKPGRVGPWHGEVALSWQRCCGGGMSAAGVGVGRFGLSCGGCRDMA